MGAVRQLAAAGCVAVVALLCAAAGVAAGSRPATGDRVSYTPLTLELGGGGVRPVAIAAPAATPSPAAPPIAGAAAKAGPDLPAGAERARRAAAS